MCLGVKTEREIQKGLADQGHSISYLHTHTTTHAHTHTHTHTTHTHTHTPTHTHTHTHTTHTHNHTHTTTHQNISYLPAYVCTIYGALGRGTEERKRGEGLKYA